MKIRVTDVRAELTGGATPIVQATVFVHGCKDINEAIKAIEGTEPYDDSVMAAYVETCGELERMVAEIKRLQAERSRQVADAQHNGDALRSEVIELSNMYGWSGK